MKQGTCLIVGTVAMTVLIMVSPAGGADAGKGPDALREAEGLWVGTGKITRAADPDLTCSSGEIPVLFYVREGQARSLFPSGLLSFEAELKPNGKIKFAYKEAATMRRGGGWSHSSPIEFSGKLKGARGSGRVSFGQCMGKWTVSKQQPDRAHGVEFLIFDDRLLMVREGELVNFLKPREGRRFVNTHASGDFFLVNVDEDPVTGSTLVYQFEDPLKVKKIAVIPGHRSFSEKLSLDEARGLDLALEDEYLRLYQNKAVKDDIGPTPGKRIVGFCACGDFIAVHESDDQDKKSTIVYYLKDEDILSLVGAVFGGHYRF